MASRSRRSSISFGWIALLSLICGCTGSTNAPDDSPVDLDLIFRGGTVIDGTGAPPRIADVGIRGDRIVAIGNLAQTTANRVLDAEGLVLAPGFIDMHSHADSILLGTEDVRNPLLQAKLRQGVTTLIVGNCGLGPSPSVASTVELLRGINAWMTPTQVVPTPLEFADYLAAIETAPLPLNVGSLLAHGPVRIQAMGMSQGDADDAQLESMRQSVRQALHDGAFGMSVGLIYPPGMYSSTDELVELAAVVADQEGLFTAHIRGSSELLLPGTAELIEIARRSGARVHHSHLEAVGEPFWSGIEQTLRLEDEAREQGLSVSHDVFPYTRAATMMAAIFPPWSLEGGVPQLLRRLREPETRERIRISIQTDRPTWPPWVVGGWPHNLVAAVGWDGIRISSLPQGAPAEWIGLDLETLGRQQGISPFDSVADLMLRYEGRVGQWVDEISGDDRQHKGLSRILKHPAGAIVSDAEDYGRGAPHPAHAGAFARTLRWNRELGLGSLQDFVRRMTGYPAQRLGLTHRGLVREGYYADLVVFGAGEVTDHADWNHPREAATGFRWVVVNGRIAVEDDRRTPENAGLVLRAGQSTARLRSNSSPSTVVASTPTMRSDARPSP